MSTPSPQILVSKHHPPKEEKEPGLLEEMVDSRAMSLEGLSVPENKEVLTKMTKSCRKLHKS